MLKKSLPFVVGTAVIVGCVGLGANAAYGTGGPGGHTPVTVCHNGHTITIDDSALKAHLKHGDTIGACKDCPAPSTPVTTPPATPPAEPTEPETPPTSAPPAPDVIEPQIQDYINCKGAAFVLDNTSSNVAVTYDINGLIYVVAAGEAKHTDDDGTIIQPNSDFEGYKIKAGDRTWHFESAGNCPTTPTEPPTPTPTGTPTLPPTPTPGSTDSGTPTPIPSIEPTTTPTPSQSAVAPPTGTSEPSPTARTKTDSGTTPKTHSTDATARTLAYTGTNAIGPLIAAGVLLALGGITLWIARRRKEQ